MQELGSKQKEIVLCLLDASMHCLQVRKIAKKLQIKTDKLFVTANTLFSRGLIEYVTDSQDTTAGISAQSYMRLTRSGIAVAEQLKQEQTIQALPS